MLSAGGNRRILVIDDEVSVHEVFRGVLSMAPRWSGPPEEILRKEASSPTAVRPNAGRVFEVDCAASGEAGLELVKKAVAADNPYAVVFVDMRMPTGWNGVMTTERLWDVDPGLQVVISTAYADHDWSDVILRLQRMDQLLFLRKPYDAIELWQMARALASRWDLQREAELKRQDLQRQVELRMLDLEAANDRLRDEIAARQSETAERLMMERRLLRTQKLESLELVAGGIAHDFNNILTAILGHAALARMDITAASTLHSPLEQIEKAAHRAAGLCRQMLAYAGKGKMSIRSVHLNSVVQASLPLLEAVVSKKARLELDLDPGLPMIDADPLQIQQVIVNLATNASEALGDREGVVHLRTQSGPVDPSAFKNAAGAPILPPGTYAHLEVTDTGCGIPPEVLENVFDPFFTTKFQGRGLGLAAVLGIMRAHRGAVTVNSEPGQGTTLNLYFPAVGPAPAAVDPSRNAHPTGLPRSSRGAVLVVDDESQVREVAAMALERFGFEVVSASDGLEALDLCRSCPQQFRLILLDVTMPRLSGPETLREIRALGLEIPVLLMSGYSERDAVADHGGCRPSGFLQKPFKPAELEQKLLELLS